MTISCNAFERLKDRGAAAINAAEP